MWRVVVSDLETTKFLLNEEEAKAHWRAIAPREKKNCVWLVIKKKYITIHGNMNEK